MARSSVVTSTRAKRDKEERRDTVNGFSGHVSRTPTRVRNVGSSVVSSTRAQPRRTGSSVVSSTRSQPRQTGSSVVSSTRQEPRRTGSSVVSREGNARTRTTGGSSSVVSRRSFMQDYWDAYNDRSRNREWANRQEEENLRRTGRSRVSYYDPDEDLYIEEEAELANPRRRKRGN